jgi:hypothetical protein
VKVAPKAAADAEPVLRRDSYVSLVEERVNVGAQQDSIVHSVRTALSNGSNVTCLENGQGAFAGNGAPSLVSLGDERSEGPLSKASSDQGGVAPHRPIDLSRRALASRFLDFLEQSLTVKGRQVVGLALNDVGRPVGRGIDPIVLR